MEGTRILLTKENDNGEDYWFAEHIDILYGCAAHGATPEEAIAELKEIRKLYLEERRKVRGL